MSEIKVVFWSGTGNTAQMATALGDGITAAGKTVVYKPVDTIKAAELDDDMVFALGCPSMGAEQLEESEMEPFMLELDTRISGKKIALFGSYGWGNEEWMRDWEARLVAGGARVVKGEGVTCLGAPDDDTIAALKELGSMLAGE